MKTQEDIAYRLKLVTDKHQHQHNIISALEAEKAPDKAIKSAKVLKLKLKDEMEYLKRL